MKIIKKQEPKRYWFPPVLLHVHGLNGVYRIEKLRPRKVNYASSKFNSFSTKVAPMFTTQLPQRTRNIMERVPREQRQRIM